MQVLPTNANSKKGRRGNLSRQLQLGLGKIPRYSLWNSLPTDLGGVSTVSLSYSRRVMPVVQQRVPGNGETLGRQQDVTGSMAGSCKNEGGLFSEGLEGFPGREKYHQTKFPSFRFLRAS